MVATSEPTPASPPSISPGDPETEVPAERPAHPGALLAVRMVSACWTVALVTLLLGLAILVLTGWRLDVVTSASMDPAIPKGSAVLARPVRPSDVEALEVGDVITFRHPQVEAPVMHRIVEVVEQRGQRAFVVQGDANARPDGRIVPSDDVAARVEASTPWLGSVLKVLRPPFGVVLLVVVPVVLALAVHLLGRPTSVSPPATDS